MKGRSAVAVILILPVTACASLGVKTSGISGPVAWQAVEMNVSGNAVLGQLELVFVRAGSERNEWLNDNFHARRRKRLRWLWCAQARRACSRRRAVATTAARGTPTGAVCFATNLCELAMWAWLFCPGMEDRPGWERRGGP